MTRVGQVGQKRNYRFDTSALLPIAALCAMAISHPLYDLLLQRDHATFFVAHESKAIDIYLLVFTLSVALPLALFIALWIFNLFSNHWARALYALVIFLLLAAFFMPVSKRLFGDLDWGNVALGFGAAILCTFLFATLSWARDLLSFAALAALVSPALFLTSPVMRSFLATPEAQNYTLEFSFETYPNIVMVVFDELPLFSLLDEDRQIDDVRFPNFARLAKTSTWYRNTVTAHTTTSKAVPSLLTGRYVNTYQPIAGSASYPDSLVSYLSTTHQLRGVEVVTTFFDHTGSQAIHPTFGFRSKRMGMDLLVVLGHLLLPQTVANRLPAIDSQWSNFRSPSPKVKGTEAVRPRAFREFIELLRTSPRSSPTFFYLHLLLPHSPLRYNDDGRSIGNELYGYGLGTRSPSLRTYAKNEQDSLLIYQAHLLQTRFVDLILGEILDELESLGLFGDSLMIVTSDHGIGYGWYDEGVSDLAAIRAGEVYWVPLFIKRPNQQEGGIQDEEVSTIDIFPTVAEILGRPIPWSVDGLSVSGSKRERENRPGNPEKGASWRPVGNRSFKALENKIALFGQHNLKELYFFGPHKDLIGRRADALPLKADIPSAGLVRLDTGPTIESTEAHVPFYLKGELSSIHPTLQPDELELAISINGVIRGTTRPSIKDNRTTFTTRIPTESWAAGENAVSVYAIFAEKGSEERSLALFSER